METTTGQKRNRPKNPFLSKKKMLEKMKKTISRPRKEVDKKTGRRMMTNVSKRADGSIRGGTTLKGTRTLKGTKTLKGPGTLRPADKAAINKKMRVLRKRMSGGGKSDFGMLSVKAGIDKNPNPTKADRIAGATSRKPLAKGGGSDTHVTKDGRTVKKGLYYYMNRAKKRGTSRKGKGTVTDKALARSAKTAKKPAKKKKA